MQKQPVTYLTILPNNSLNPRVKSSSQQGIKLLAHNHQP